MYIYLNILLGLKFQLLRSLLGMVGGEGGGGEIKVLYAVYSISYNNFSD